MTQLVKPSSHAINKKLYLCQPLWALQQKTGHREGFITYEYSGLLLPLEQTYEAAHNIL